MVALQPQTSNSEKKHLNNDHSGCHSYWTLRAQCSQTLRRSMTVWTWIFMQIILAVIHIHAYHILSYCHISCWTHKKSRLLLYPLHNPKAQPIASIYTITISKHSIEPIVSSFNRILSRLPCKQQNHNASRHHLQWQVISIVQLPHEDAHMKPCQEFLDGIIICSTSRKHIDTKWINMIKSTPHPNGASLLKTKDTCIDVCARVCVFVCAPVIH